MGGSQEASVAGADQGGGLEGRAARHPQLTCGYWSAGQTRGQLQKRAVPPAPELGEEGQPCHRRTPRGSLAAGAVLSILSGHAVGASPAGGHFNPPPLPVRVPSRKGIRPVSASFSRGRAALRSACCLCVGLANLLEPTEDLLPFPSER